MIELQPTSPTSYKLSNWGTLGVHGSMPGGTKRATGENSLGPPHSNNFTCQQVVWKIVFLYSNSTDVLPSKI